jgi:hypothetical protein
LAKCISILVLVDSICVNNARYKSSFDSLDETYFDAGEEEVMLSNCFITPFCLTSKSDLSAPLNLPKRVYILLLFCKIQLTARQLAAHNQIMLAIPFSNILISGFLLRAIARHWL